MLQSGSERQEFTDSLVDEAGEEGEAQASKDDKDLGQ